MNFLLCQACGQHYWMTESHCPHCHTSSSNKWVKGSANAAVTLLLGLGVVGCRQDTNEKNPTDTGHMTTSPLYGVPDTGGPDTGNSDTGIDTAIGDLYGVPDVDNDADGWLEFQDCDDNDANTFPGAAANDSETECMKDADGDDYGDAAPTNSAVTAGTDCDDSDADVYPGQGC